MIEPEFDRYADEYYRMHQESIRASGEEPEYFARYKSADTRQLWDARYTAEEPGAILDFGGGTGASSPHLREFFPLTKLVLADVSSRSLELAANRNVPDLDLLHFDGTALPIEDDRFDIALIACVLHHVPEQKHVSLLAEVRRVLKPGGLLVLFEHNPWNPLTRRAVDNCPFDENAVLITAATLRSRMAAAGLKSIATAYRIFFPNALKLLRPIEPALKWLPLGAQYRNIGMK
jgi:ubiquinone/menaquinone biosynthesis C-methylase UbiE